MKKFITLILVLTASLCGSCQRKETSHPQTLRLLCGAGLRPAVEEAIAVYEKQSGVRIETDYAGSGMLVARAKLEKDVDLFLPGDLSYLEELQKDNLIHSTAMVAYLVPVILVEPGNPKHITGVADLMRPDVKVGLGRPETCQIGRTTEQIFKKNGIPLESVRGDRVVEATQVPELATWVVTKKVDAAIIWDANALQYANAAEAVTIPPDKNVTASVAVGVMVQSSKKDAAEKFAQFLASDAGKVIFRKHGYQTEPPQQGNAEDGAR